MSLFDVVSFDHSPFTNSFETYERIDNLPIPVKLEVGLRLNEYVMSLVKTYATVESRCVLNSIFEFNEGVIVAGMLEGAAWQLNDTIFRSYNYSDSIRFGARITTYAAHAVVALHIDQLSGAVKRAAVSHRYAVRLRDNAEYDTQQSSRYLLDFLKMVHGWTVEVLYDLGEDHVTI